MSRKILLVAEDEPNDAFFLKRALEKAGVSIPVSFVRDGQEAVDYIQGQHQFADRNAHPFPSLLLLDLKMPRLDGFDVLKWLQNNPPLNRLTVVVYSSSDDLRDINRAYDLGANSYATKPKDSSQLLEFVNSLQTYWFQCHCYPECHPR